MKKRILAAFLLCAVLFTGVFLCGDFHRYEKGTRTVAAYESGLLFSITAFDGAGESELFLKSLGHAWLSLENKTGHTVTLGTREIENGETLTFSVWAIVGHSGAVYGLEPHFIDEYDRYKGRLSLTVPIGEEKLTVIENYIASHDEWHILKNCSRFSVELWNEVVGETYALPEQKILYTPKRLTKALSEYDCVEKDKQFTGAKAIAFPDGTELTLCD